MSRSHAGRRAEARVVVAGGGVAGLEAALALRALAGDRVEVEIVAPEHHFYYRPLAVAEPFGGPPVHRWELADLARRAGAEFTPGEVVAINADGRAARAGRRQGRALGRDAGARAPLRSRRAREPRRGRSPRGARNRAPRGPVSRRVRGRASRLPARARRSRPTTSSPSRT